MTLAASLLLLSLSPEAQAGAVVSSFKSSGRSGLNEFNAQAAIDGKLETAWQLPGDSTNVGEHITIDVPKTVLDKVGMVIGWEQNEKAFFDYARVKTIKIEAEAYDENNELQPAGTATATFEDKMGWQVVDIEDITIGTDFFGGKVKITVTEVYPGKDYTNLAVSELLLHMAEPHSPTLKVLSVSGEEGTNVQANLVDGNDKTFWVAPSQEASFTVEAEGFSLSRIGLKAVSKEYDRAKKVRVTVKGRSQEFELPDTLNVEWVQIPPVIGFTGSAWGEVQIEVLETYAGSKYAGKLGLRSLEAKATAFDG
jgi:hypothetical protein